MTDTNISERCQNFSCNEIESLVNLVRDGKARYTLTDWEENKVECGQFIGDYKNWSMIPCLNTALPLSIADQQLVRFTGMVQDMHNPEMYLEQYEVRDTVTNQSRIKCGKYRDVPTYNENEVFVEDSTNNINADRQTYYCISVPALNNWVKQHHNKTDCDQVHCEPVQHANKRPYPDDNETTSNEGSSGTSQPDTKRLCPTFQPPVRDPSQEINLSFPLPDPQAKSCILKVYDNTNLALNDIIEVVGFLTVTPESPVESEELEMDEDMDSHYYNRVGSLVPRLHAVTVNKLQHCNPLIHPALDNTDEIVAAASAVRDELKLVLSQALLGDQLAAEYLICHLISSVFQRSDLMTLGKFCLNISRIPTVDGYGRELYSLLEKIVTKSHYSLLTLQSLNGTSFLPKKDYDRNRLLSGMLQLSAHTHLVLDETGINQGKLETNGVLNVMGIGNLIQQQIVNYDFQYYKLEFSTDVPVLTLSEGKSLFPNDVALPLEIDEKCLETRNEIFEAVNHYLKEPLLEKIRKYITVVQLLEYSIPKDLEQVIQDDFVKWRRENGSRTSSSDLHLQLVFARLMSLSRGEKILSKESWELACSLENQRKQRLSSTQRP